MVSKELGKVFLSSPVIYSLYIFPLDSIPTSFFSLSPMAMASPKFWGLQFYSVIQCPLLAPFQEIQPFCTLFGPSSIQESQ